MKKRKSDTRLAEGVPYDRYGLSRQHNGVTGDFNDLSKAFKSNPTIEHYVQLRRSNPEVLIEVATSWSIDWLFANADILKQHGINPETMAGALDADPACISAISLKLMECLIEREAKESAGETHVQSRGNAIGNSLVSYLIAMMLDALDRNDEMHIPRDLVVLIKHQIGAERSSEDRAMEARNNRSNSTWIAALLRYQGQPGSIRQVARTLNLNPSTVARWFNDENTFEEEVQKQLSVLRSDMMAHVRERLDSYRK